MSTPSKTAAGFAGRLPGLKLTMRDSRICASVHCGFGLTGV